MPLNIQNKKVEIFSGINDTPVAPTSSKGGNGSHFISLYNGLIDSLTEYANSVDALINASSSNWLYVTYGFEIIGTQKIFTPGGSDPLVFTLEQFPTTGTEVSFMQLATDSTIKLQMNGTNYFDETQGSIYPQALTFTAHLKAVSLMYSGSYYGWIPTETGIFTAVMS